MSGLLLSVASILTKANWASCIQLLGLASVWSTIPTNASSPPNAVGSMPFSTSTVYLKTLAVPWPNCGVPPGTICQDLSPAPVNGPPLGSTPVGRLASNCVRPRGGASMITVPTAPILGGPCTGWPETGADALVPVTVWYSTTTVRTASTGSAYARQP